MVQNFFIDMETVSLHINELNMLTNNETGIIVQKMKFFIQNFFSKCDQPSSFLWISSHLLKKSLMENFTFCAVNAFKWLTTTNRLTLLCNIFDTVDMKEVSP